MVDSFLCKIPDQPETSSDKPGGRTLLGECSNSIPDWLQVTEIDDPDDGVCHDDTDDDPSFSGGGTSLVNVLSSSLGSGLSPDHGHM